MRSIAQLQLIPYRRLKLLEFLVRIGTGRLLHGGNTIHSEAKKMRFLRFSSLSFESLLMPSKCKSWLNVAGMVDRGESPSYLTQGFLEDWFQRTAKFFFFDTTKWLYFVAIPR